MILLKILRILSWIGLALLWPPLFLGTIFMSDNVPTRAIPLLTALIYSMFAWPVVWIVCLVVTIVESRWKKRPKVLRAAFIASYAPLVIYGILLAIYASKYGIT